MVNIKLQTYRLTSCYIRPISIGLTNSIIIILKSMFNANRILQTYRLTSCSIRPNSIGLTNSIIIAYWLIAFVTLYTKFRAIYSWLSFKFYKTMRNREVRYTF